MSWSITVPATPKDQFDAAVDAAVVTGQTPDKAPELNADVAAGKDALKVLAKRVKRSKVSGGASGHSLEPGQDKGWSDHIQANAYGSD